jgi:hypothetical protein
MFVQHYLSRRKASPLTLWKKVNDLGDIIDFFKNIHNYITTNMKIIRTPKNKFAWIVTGLFQSDGYFSLIIKKNKTSKFGIDVSLVLGINLTLDSLPLLQQVQIYFGCGKISIDKTRKMCLFSITDLSSLWHIVLPQFMLYPFFGDKQVSFIRFVQILTLLYPYNKKVKSALLLGKVIYLGYFLNPGSNRTTTEFKNLFKILNLDIKIVITSINQEHLNNITKYFKQNNTFINIYFIIGVIEGDGSFYVGLRTNRKIRFGFNITTHIYELDLLYKIKWFLNCGNTKIKSDNWCRYEVEGSKILRNLFIPLVDSIGLLGSKANNFETFKEAMNIFTKKEHLTDEGLRKLVEIVYNNTSKKGIGRKYTLEQYLKINNLST